MKTDTIRAILKSYARNISTEANNTKIIVDISDNIGRTIDFKTFAKYEQALKDLRTYGFIFEDFVIHELRVYLSNKKTSILHYRDNAGLECDAVLKLKNGDYALVEIKIGGEEQINDAARHLTLLKNKITNKSDEKPPKFLMIITAVGSLYKRPDGIYVVPINTLCE